MVLGVGLRVSHMRDKYVYPLSYPQPLKSLLDVNVYVCVYICVWAFGDHRVLSVNSSPFETGFLPETRLTVWLDWLASKLQGAPPAPQLGWQAWTTTPMFLCEFWRLNSGPSSCLWYSKPSAGWAISPAPRCQLLECWEALIHIKNPLEVYTVLKILTGFNADTPERSSFFGNRCSR